MRSYQCLFTHSAFDDECESPIRMLPRTCFLLLLLLLLSSSSPPLLLLLVVLFFFFFLFFVFVFFFFFFLLSISCPFSPCTLPQQAPGTGGYLFSVSTPDGNTRQASLYLSSTGTFATLYYLPAGAGTTSTSVRFTMPASVVLNDGAVHRLELTVDNAVAAIAVDGTPIASTAVAGPIAGCAAAGITCVPVLGARASATGGEFGLTGTIRRCELIANRSSPGVNLTLPPPGKNVFESCFLFVLDSLSRSRYTTRFVRQCHLILQLLFIPCLRYTRTKYRFFHMFCISLSPERLR